MFKKRLGEVLSSSFPFCILLRIWFNILLIILKIAWWIYHVWLKAVVFKNRETIRNYFAILGSIFWGSTIQLKPSLVPAEINRSFIIDMSR